MSGVTYICFDYGEKRIGVAVGQTVTGTATPLETVRVINTKPDWGKITAIIRQWQPQGLIVGLPINMDDSRQPLTEAAEKFARQLNGRYHLPVYRADERLTTFEARDRTGRSTGLDPVAAQVILESWLREKNNANDEQA